MTPSATAWPRRRAAAGLDLRIGDTAVATYDLGLGTAPTSSPHPFLHPVRTLGGFTVTDAHPADHDWHVGIGVAVQDVNGWNLWGGRTYVRDAGYQWLGDHGRIEHVRWNERNRDAPSKNLAWVDGRGGELLRERRELRWGPAAGARRAPSRLGSRAELHSQHPGRRGFRHRQAGQSRFERARGGRLRRVLLAAPPHR